MKTLAFHYRGKDYRVSLEKETLGHWGGLWNGKIPRILDAWIEDIDLKEGREK